MPLIVVFWELRPSFHMQGILADQFDALLRVLLRFTTIDDHVGLGPVLLSSIIALLITRDTSSDTHVVLAIPNIGCCTT